MFRLTFAGVTLKETDYDTVTSVTMQNALTMYHMTK